MGISLTLLVCVATAIVTLWVFQNTDLREKLIFDPHAILALKQWYRLFSCAVIHANGAHLFFNLITIYSFGSAIEFGYGSAVFLLVYALSILGGSLLSLYIHRNHAYAALGASGGGCGVLFAAIFLQPGTGVGMFLLPISIPGPIYAVGFLIWSFIAMRRRKDNIGHDAHFGGAITGLALALVFAHENCFASPVLFSTCLLISAVGLYIAVKDPLAITGKFRISREPEYKANIRYQDYDVAKQRRAEANEVDRILEKISSKGLDSLSAKEKALLAIASAKVRKD